MTTTTTTSSERCLGNWIVQRKIESFLREEYDVLSFRRALSLKTRAVYDPHSILKVIGITLRCLAASGLTGRAVLSGSVVGWLLNELAMYRTINITVLPTRTQPASEIVSNMMNSDSFKALVEPRSIYFCYSPQTPFMFNSHFLFGTHDRLRINIAFNTDINAIINSMHCFSEINGTYILFDLRDFHTLPIIAQPTVAQREYRQPPHLWISRKLCARRGCFCEKSSRGLICELFNSGAKCSTGVADELVKRMTELLNK